MQSNSFLTVNNLVVKTEFSQSILVDNISFNLHEGEVLGIVGESGSGKSLTALSIANLIREIDGLVCSGQVLFKNVNVLEKKDNELQQFRRSEVAYIFQDPLKAFNPSKTCKNQLLEVLPNKINSQPRLIDILLQVGIKEPQRILKSYPHELSGGQLQRVMIAMALAKEAKIIIADEPTTALDTTIQKEVLDVLKKLVQEQKLSMIYISHDISTVNYCADRILVMKNGVIIERGTCSNLIKNPQNDYTQLLVTPLKLDTKKADISLDAPLLNVSDLSVKYSKRKHFLSLQKVEVVGVDNISFHVNKNESVGFIGESGSGKTTIGKALVNLAEVNSGIIDFDGDYSQMQMIFQNPKDSLNPRLTVESQIKEVIVHRKGNKSVDDYLKLVELNPDFKKRYVHQLSGGEAQRVVFARALAAEPKLLILDEAIGSLDKAIQAKVLVMLDDLKDRLNLSYMMISHDIGIVSQFCNRIYILNEGRIIEEANPSSKVFASSNVYTKRLIDAQL